MENKKCPKCSGEMGKGMIASKNIIGAGFPIAYCRDIDRIWFGQLKESKDIVTLRCQSCGYLENYAK